MAGYCNSTGIVCSGRGRCSAGTCICQNLYESSSECAVTYFATWGNSMLILSSVALVMYSLLFLVALADFVPDVWRLGKRVFTTPFALAKLILLMLCIGIIIELTWYAENSSSGQLVLLEPLWKTATEGVYVLLLGAYVTLVVLSWIELIERARALDEAKWLMKVRLATIILAVVTLGIAVIIMIVNFASHTDDQFKLLSTLQSIIPGVFVLYLLIISIVMLVRGKSWWHFSGGKEVVLKVRIRTKWFIGILVVLATFVIFAVISTTVPSNSTTFFANVAIWYLVEYFSLMLVAFLFIQRNIYRSGRWFPSVRSMSTSERESTDDKKGATSANIVDKSSRHIISNNLTNHVDKTVSTMTMADEGENDGEVPEKEKTVISINQRGTEEVDPLGPQPPRPTSDLQSSTSYSDALSSTHSSSDVPSSTHSSSDAPSSTHSSSDAPSSDHSSSIMPSSTASHASQDQDKQSTVS